MSGGGRLGTESAKVLLSAYSGAFCTASNKSWNRTCGVGGFVTAATVGGGIDPAVNRPRHNPAAAILRPTPGARALEAASLKVKLRMPSILVPSGARVKAPETASAVSPGAQHERPCCERLQ